MTEPKIAVIDFFCGITHKSAQALISIVNNALSQQSTEIVIRLASGGGSLSPTFAAYHFLRSLETPLKIYNMGNVESSAMLLYLAGEIRVAAPTSRFLIHPFDWTFAPGPVFLPALREAVASLDFDSTRYSEIFNERTKNANKPIDVLKCLNGEPSVIGAEDARLAGITTEDPAVYAIPTGALHAWIVES